MPVYVDKLREWPKSARWPFGEACHLVADSLDELHLFAGRIGLKREWFQGTHYDLTADRRRNAVALGAIEITNRLVLLEKIRHAGDEKVARQAAEAGLVKPPEPEPSDGKLF